MIHHALYIQASPPRGRGVFTREAIPEQTILEIAPVIVMTQADRLHLDQTKLHDYIFEWGPDQAECCMALGQIPIYNHSSASNAEYFMDYEQDLMFIKSVRAIQAGEEITINYNGDWNDSKPVWFDQQDPA